MYKDIIDKLNQFAQERKLLFEYSYNEKTRTYRFRFQDQERAWAFYRELSDEDVELCKAPPSIFTNDIINNVEKVLAFTGRVSKNSSCGYCFDPSYTIDKDGNMQLNEISLIRK